MKIRNRDINIFSMSALDLFASGMGAFILLAVMALPFFGNVSKIPTEAPLQCPEPVICPKPVPCEVCPPPTPPVPPGFKKMEKLDLVVVLDITGSMSGEINGLKTEIRDIAALLDRLSDSAAMRIVVFGDDAFDVPVTHFPLTLTQEIDVLLAQLQRVKVDVGIGRGGNTTDGEAVLPGFMQAMQTIWRTDSSRRTVVIITDDGAHPGDDRRLLSAVNAFTAQSSTNTVSVRYSGNVKAQHDFYTEVVAAGKGSYLDKNNGSLTAALLLALLPK
ncbi:vWA domain-containing protein [Alishewanella tabrizica]|uniref:VWFA domain-containing protein n=1 Tax=Alishewanella tabrizica TaxID=671278 RepID=A0ABQ2WT99_9ALTE|nr:vWA domain-containing protein [Alishewanella tabrizica]GGW73385.1 hypothetical protein GCM10008111_31730 [Alishewanella tabrizica]